MNCLVEERKSNHPTPSGGTSPHRQGDCFSRCYRKFPFGRTEPVVRGTKHVDQAKVPALSTKHTVPRTAHLVSAEYRCRATKGLSSRRMVPRLCRASFTLIPCTIIVRSRSSALRLGTSDD